MTAPLLVTSCYSFLYGTTQPAALAERAAAYGYKALALTDRNAVHGLPTFIEACKKAGIRPIMGTELVYPGGRAVLLCKGKPGFARLSNLLTLRAEGSTDARPAITEDHAGLIVLTDDETLLAQTADAHGESDVYALLTPFNRGSWRRLSSGPAPCVASGEVRFLDPSDREVQRVLVAIGRKTTVGHVSDGELADSGAMLPSCREFEAAYRDVPEALARNEEIVETAAYSSLFDGFVFPRYETSEQGGSGALLRRLVLEGAAERYTSIDERVSKRIDYELDIIGRKGFCDYFLTVRDIARKASRTCGRGSAAASIVSYCLGITDVDPIRHNLYFDRFLNPGRVDPPDIDVDFAWDERDGLIASVTAAYGEARTARVSNHVCFQRDAALRETARAYGIPDGEISAFERHRVTRPESEAEHLDESWTEILRIASKLEGLPRNIGVHSGGVIIVPDRIADHVPVERSGSGIRVTAWDKDGVEAAGLVKIDLLGNRSLAVVRDALANLQENGKAIDEARWRPIDDRVTVDLLARGDTMGVFYVESPAMRLLQRKTKHGDFEHLVIQSSIIRPAANAYINEYVDRLNGKPWKPLHPLLAGLFDETYGIMCYQEDVSKAAIALAGFSASEADGIRKIFARKDADARLRERWPAFEAGAQSRGVDGGTIRAVWDMMRSFSGYSFVKAHSASYAMLSFKSAFLRAHHPAEFMAAVISNRGGFYSTLAYVSESRRMGLKVLPPDVNASEVRCQGKDGTILWGLGLIASLESKTAADIVAERTRGGPFASIDDFAFRVSPGRGNAEPLVGSGALDALSPELSRAEKLMRLLSLYAVREKAGACPELFPDESPHRAAKGISVVLPSRVPERKLLETQMKYLGTTLDRHPLALWPWVLERSRVYAKDIPCLTGSEVELVGWPITAKSVLTSTGEAMEFVSFEDETALFETTVFPDVFRRFHHLLYEERPLVIRGKVEEDRGAFTVTVSSIEKTE